MRKIVTDLLAFVLALVEGLLILRFILKLLAANPQATFVQWIYDMTQPLLNPFLGAFPAPAVQGGFTLEFTTLFAILVYSFVGYLLQELLLSLSEPAVRSKR